MAAPKVKGLLSMTLQCLFFIILLTADVVRIRSDIGINSSVLLFLSLKQGLILFSCHVSLTHFFIAPPARPLARSPTRPPPTHQFALSSLQSTKFKAETTSPSSFQRTHTADVNSVIKHFFRLDVTPCGQVHAHT
jgi:hypothetical protein